MTENADITKAVEKKIYPIATKSEVKFPFIVYERNSVTPAYDKIGPAATDIYVTIYVLSESYGESESIAEMVIAALDKVQAQYDEYDVENAILTDVSEDYVNQTFVQQIKFKFTIKSK